MKLAWKEIRFHLKKYLLIEGLLVMMIFMVMFLSGLANGLARAVSSAIENIEAPYFAMDSDADSTIALSSISKEQLSELTDKTDKSTTGLSVQRSTVTMDSSSDKLDVTYFVIDPDGILNPDQALTYVDYTIVLDDSYKDQGVKLGDMITDTKTGYILVVTGFTKDAMYGHTPVGYISEATYTAMMQSQNPDYDYSYQVLALPSDKWSDLSMDGISIISKDQVVDNIPGYSAEQMTIRMILWVLVFVSAGVLGVFFYILTLQKQKQFGVMKAIGLSMKELNIMLISQVLLIAGTGVLTGDLLSYLMSLALPNSMPFYIKYWDSLLVSLAFVGIAVLFSLLSMVQVARIDPAKIIGGSEES